MLTAEKKLQIDPQVQGYSYSRLALFEQCPAAYYRKYVLEEPEEPSEALELGKAVHEIIEKFFKYPDIEIEEAINQAIEKAAVKLNPHEIKMLIGHEMVNNLALIINGIGNPEELVEVWYENIPAGEGKKICGRIDVVIPGKDTVDIYDWKTGHKIYEPLSNNQMGLYAYIVSQIYEVEEVTCNLVFLRYNSAEAIKTKTYKRKDIERARLWALSLISKIEENFDRINPFDNPFELFSPTPNANCRYCSYAFKCGTAAFGVLGIDQITDSETAKYLLEEAIRLEKTLEHIFRMLKEWTKTNGAIRLDGCEFSNKPYDIWEFTDLKGLCRELKEKGYNPWEFLKISGSDLIKKTGWTEEQLLKYGTKKTRDNYQIRKIKN